MRIHVACLFFILINVSIISKTVEGACVIFGVFNDPDLKRSPPARTYYNDGDNIEYSCPEGQTLRGPTTATCTGSSLVPSDIPQCKAKCPGRNGPFEDGQKIPLNCPNGYKLEGSSSATCRDGNWDPSKPTCLKICKRPSFFAFDLNISPSQFTYLEGDVITYSCKEGHRLYGETSATCTKQGFDPPEVPQCEEKEAEEYQLTVVKSILDILQCHTEKQTICEPSGSDCNNYAPSSENQQRNVHDCHDNAKLCFIYRFGVQGNTVTVNTTTSGCVTNEELNIEYGCYDRSYLESVDSSGAEKLSELERALGTEADDVQVCVCDRDACNESVETAARNDSTTAPIEIKMILGILMGYLSLWI